MTLRAIAVFDIDGVIRDVSGSYRRALADTVEHFTQGGYRPTPEAIDALKAEGGWNNDWEASRELICRYFEGEGKPRSHLTLDFDAIVDFFQRRYRGSVLEDPAQWDGYVTQEPLLVQAPYFHGLSRHQIAWGFFSGATRGSATYVLEQRLGLAQPPLVAMHDAPGKPDPTGLFEIVAHLMHQRSPTETPPVLYVGDTVADMQTVQRAMERRVADTWIGVGVLPPHVTANGPDYVQQYAAKLRSAGAAVVLPSVRELVPDRIVQVINDAMGR